MKTTKIFAVLLGVALAGAMYAETILTENFDTTPEQLRKSGWSGKFKLGSEKVDGKAINYISGEKNNNRLPGATAVVSFKPLTGPFKISFKMAALTKPLTSQFMLLGNRKNASLFQVYDVRGSLRVIVAPGLQYSFLGKAKKAKWLQLEIDFDPGRKDVNCLIRIDGKPVAIYPLTTLQGQEVSRLAFSCDARIANLKIEKLSKPVQFPADADKYTMLLPAAPRKKCGPNGEPIPDSNIFKQFVNDRAPEIVKVISEKKEDGLIIKEVLFKSLVIDGKPQLVYAVMARPVAKGKYPGIVFYHGGSGYGSIKEAVKWAKRGYIAIAPDLPGIGNAKKCVHSVGVWKQLPYSTARWYAKPNITTSVLFDAEVAALQAYFLLAGQPDVIKDKIGITGVSWGGYTTTMVTGLLGARPAAAFSIYGAGWYDEGSVFQGALRRLKGGERKAWFDEYDAGRKALNIKVPFYYAVAVRDFFFWPPSVNKSYKSIKSEDKFITYAPNRSHNLGGIDGLDKMQEKFFDYYLKGKGTPLPKVARVTKSLDKDGSMTVDVAVNAATKIKEVRLYFSPKDNKDWRKRKWQAIKAETADGKNFKITVPANLQPENGNFYVVAIDENLVSSGSPVFEGAKELK